MFVIATTTYVPFSRRNISICKASGHRLFFFGGSNNNGWRCLSSAAAAAAVRTQEAPPMLMLSSPIKPDHRYLFDITFTDDQKKLQLNREIHLPQISDNLFIGSSEGLLISIPTCGSSTDITVLNPLTGSHLPIPPTSTLIKVPPTLSPQYMISRQTAAAVHDYYHRFKGKAILSPSREYAVILCRLQADFARLEETSSTWIRIPYLLCPVAPEGSSPSPLHSLEDCAFYKGHLYLVDSLGRLAVVDINNLLSGATPPRFYSCIAPLEGQDTSHFRRYLVVSPDGDDLFLVYRALDTDDWYRTGFFMVCKLCVDDDGGYEWDLVDSIRDLALFVGPNCSTSLPASDFPNIKPNSIYFTDEFPYYSKSNYQANYEDLGDTGVFSLEDKSTQFFELTEDQLQLNRPPAVWFTPTAMC